MTGTVIPFPIIAGLDRHPARPKGWIGWYRHGFTFALAALRANPALTAADTFHRWRDNINGPVATDPHIAEPVRAGIEAAHAYGYDGPGWTA